MNHTCFCLISVPHMAGTRGAFCASVADRFSSIKNKELCLDVRGVLFSVSKVVMGSGANSKPWPKKK